MKNALLRNDASHSAIAGWLAAVVFIIVALVSADDALSTRSQLDEERLKRIAVESQLKRLTSETCAEWRSDKGMRYRWCRRMIAGDS